MAFSSNRYAMEDDGGGFDVYLLELETRRTTRLTRASADDHSPAINGTGNRVAFVSERDGDTDIYVLEFDGNSSPISAPFKVTNNPASDLDPAWSRDGCRITFASNRDGDWDIYITNVDGGIPVNLTDGGEDDEEGWE